MDRLAAHSYYLQYLTVATSYQRRHLLQTVTADQLRMLYEISLNVLYENIPLSEEDYSRLYKHRNVLRKLVQKEIDPYSITKKNW